MNRNELDFDIDRQSKNDYVTSTVSYVIEKGGANKLSFYEFTSAATFTEFGSGDAYLQAPIDVIVVIDDELIYYVELKDRDYLSNTKFLLNDGTFINKNKIKNAKLIQQGKIEFSYNFPIEGYERKWTRDDGETLYYKTYTIPKGIASWGEMYKDDVVRMWWDLSKVLPSIVYTKKNIPLIEIDPDSEVKKQERGLLPVSKSKEYKRLKG